VGPTYQAVMKFILADVAFRGAQAKLAAATRSLRQQQHKVDTLSGELATASKLLLELSARAAELESDVKSREEHIQKLRDRQMNLSNAREYQAILVDISTQKVDKAQIEEQAIAAIDASEKQKAVVADLTARLEVDRKKLAEISSQIDQQVRKLESEVATAKAPRDAAAEVISPSIVANYVRMADRYEGEGAAAIERPSGRDEEYLCTGCNTYLVADVYNRIRTLRDDVVYCKSCGRILYIPEELTADKAINKKKPPVDPSKPKRVTKKKVAATPAATDAVASIVEAPSAVEESPAVDATPAVTDNA
jgi:predicted  nucleic acid-binding Zn-ribbon protein